MLSDASTTYQMQALPYTLVEIEPLLWFESTFAGVVAASCQGKVDANTPLLCSSPLTGTAIADNSQNSRLFRCGAQGFSSSTRGGDP